MARRRRLLPSRAARSTSSRRKCRSASTRRCNTAARTTAACVPITCSTPASRWSRSRTTATCVARCVSRARARAHQLHKPLTQVLAMLDAVVANEGTPDVVQISGGEPTLHPDFFAILDAARARPIRHLMVNTNGIRIAQRSGLRRAARANTDRASKSTCSSIPSNRRHSRTLRGADLSRIHHGGTRASSTELDISTTLVVTLKKGLNDAEIGQHHRLRSRAALRARRDACSPSRMPAASSNTMRSAHRLTVSEIRRRIAEQSEAFTLSGHHSGALQSRHAGHGLCAQGRRHRAAAHALDRRRRSCSTARATPSRSSTTRRSSSRIFDLFATNHSAGRAGDAALGTAVLPAAGRHAAWNWLSQCIPRADRPVHGRSEHGYPRAQEILHSHRAARWAIDSVRVVQPFLSLREGGHAGRAARRSRSWHPQAPGGVGAALIASLRDRLCPMRPNRRSWKTRMCIRPY